MCARSMSCFLDSEMNFVWEGSMKAFSPQEDAYFLRKKVTSCRIGVVVFFFGTRGKAEGSKLTSSLVTRDCIDWRHYSILETM